MPRSAANLRIGWGASFLAHSDNVRYGDSMPSVKLGRVALNRTSRSTVTASISNVPLPREPSEAAPERRRQSRIPVDLQVEERSGTAVYFQRATNLSLGGLFLAGTLPHPPGTPVTLDLQLPGSAVQMNVTGEVVQTFGSGTGMGIRFVGLSRAVKDAIRGYLSSRALAPRSRKLA